MTGSAPEPTQSTTSAPLPASPPLPSPPPTELEPAPQGLEPLVAGHNRASADRINLVLAPWGWDDLDEFRTVASTFVDWSGHAQLWGQDGLPLGAGADPSQAGGADLGLFGFEPFRSHRNSMNVWTTTQSPDQPYDWFDRDLAPNLATDQVIVVLAVQRQDGSTGNSSSGQNGVFTDPVYLARETDQPFENATVIVDPGYPAGSIRHLPHELGHAMFGFADEYVGRERGYDFEPRNAFWPSCADSQVRAEGWWSDHLGEYDDQLDYWAKEMTAVGFGPTPEALVAMREQNTTAYVPGGYFEVPGSVRSAQDTLMGFNFPEYGVTNRLWAQQVLDLWSGTDR
ncbi:hypothetical protein [Pengzhenrongella phosphoraccumulans]|uniref:hypothetical protein n=1 Tax=Pengzhenrongella phosphoraccumulans TaxID=3114394 RepID=UPI00388EE4E8